MLYLVHAVLAMFDTGIVAASMQAISTHWYILSSLSTDHENQQPTGQSNAEVQVNKLVQFREKFLSVEAHVICVLTYVCVHV